MKFFNQVYPFFREIGAIIINTIGLMVIIPALASVASQHFSGYITLMDKLTVKHVGWLGSFGDFWVLVAFIFLLAIVLVLGNYKLGATSSRILSIILVIVGITNTYLNWGVINWNQLMSIELGRFVNFILPLSFTIVISWRFWRYAPFLQRIIPSRSNSHLV